MSGATRIDATRVARLAAAIGAVALAAGLVGMLVDRAGFFEAYLIGFTFWLGIALGAVALTMVHHLVGGVWGFLLRRIFEAAGGTLPLLAVSFIPLIFGLPELYRWTDPAALAASEVLRHKSAYLNVPFFVVRAVAYFTIWLALARTIGLWSREHDRTGDPHILERLKRLSAGGLILYILTTFFAGIDWLVSLEPEWYSTVFGFLVITAQALSALAFAIVAVSLLARREPLAALLSERRRNDLGGLLLTATMLWAYMALSQFLVIWAGNLPVDNRWYIHRTTGGWRWLTIGLILVHFVLPFAVLLFRGTRGGRRALPAIAGFLLAMQLLYTYWLVVPALHIGGFVISPLTLIVPLGLGGLWLGTFAWLLGRAPLVPLHTPELATAPEGVEYARS